MSEINIKRASNLLRDFKFNQLFTEELNWNQPKRVVQSEEITISVGSGNSAEQLTYIRQPIAELADVVIFEITTPDGTIPNSDKLAAMYKNVSTIFHETMLIFLDAHRSDSIWYWIKRDNSKRFPRQHFYNRAQPTDLMMSKVSAIAVDLSIGNPTVTEVAAKLKEALDVQPVTKKFYNEFKDQHTKFLEQIKGIPEERDRRWYASVLLNRLMFIYFLQRKAFIDKGNLNYLKQKFTESQQRGSGLYYREFLTTLFFEGFAKPANQRSQTANTMLGNIVYLNGGLFLPHSVEKKYGNQIDVPDQAFAELLALFDSYSWNLDDTRGGQANEINPDVLGYIFEKYINQKAFGAYYTPLEITEYLCRQTIENRILQSINTPPNTIPAAGEKVYKFTSLSEMYPKLDATLCERLLVDVLPSLSLLDPACGSGAFLIAAMKTLLNIYLLVASKADDFAHYNPKLKEWIDEAKAHPSRPYYVKRRIITDNLFGIDIMEEATEIAKLRLFLALVSSVGNASDLEPLPNIDFNILPGNSLIGLLRVDEAQVNRQLSLFNKSYQEVLAEKNQLISTYRNTSTYTQNLQDLRDKIQDLRSDALIHLNQILLNDFKTLKIKYEEATWNTITNQEGKPNRRNLTIDDIAALHPFHWGYEFDQVMNKRGGFDAIITNPPWEIFKPQAKEFFADYSEVVTKNKMTIKDFETEQTKLLQKPETRQAWLEYQSRFPHQSLYFRAAKQYKNQIAVVNDKKAGTDINFYKLFIEQCYNLLRLGGECGIVIPSGIYTDLGTKQLRELLFSSTRITGLFGFENRKTIFEGVDSRFKFVTLTFEKGGQTAKFPAAFMRQDVAELDTFPKNDALELSTELVRQLSPDSLSIMEFKEDLDLAIAKKLFQFPLLGQSVTDKWKLTLSREFDMTNDSNLFQTSSGPGRLPLYEGKMIHQFTHQWSGANAKYWVDEQEGRKAILGRVVDEGQKLDYQDYRMGFRRIGRNTDTRTMIATILPKTNFASESFNLSTGTTLKYSELLFLVSVLNSYVLDYVLRQRISANLNMFYIYQLPVPRLQKGDIGFAPLVERAARLICTTTEYKDLWEEVAKELEFPPNKKTWSLALAATTVTDRATIRAEIDGWVAHLYNLTEDEFTHILATFPLVPQPTKDAALEAYRRLVPSADDREVALLIANGENHFVEFKQRVYTIPDVLAQEVAAFTNVDGGNIFIGVSDAGDVTGLEPDYIAVDHNKPGRDSYERWIRTKLSEWCSTTAITGINYQIYFYKVNNLDICRIKVLPASKLVYVKDPNGSGPNKFTELHIRSGNQKRKLNSAESAEYALSWQERRNQVTQS